MNVEVYMTGDQIGVYSAVSFTGNNNDIVVTLTDVQPLGAPTDMFRVVVTQVSPGQTEFTNGQFVAIYAWPDSDPPSPPLYSGLNPQHDQFQDRASATDHMIFTTAPVVFDVNGVTPGTMTYGPGNDPPRMSKLPFSALPSTPPAVPCFTPGTLITTPEGPVPVERLRPGDLVETLDHGPQPLRWVGARTVEGMGRFAPIRIAAGALGNRRALCLSPQHRVLLRDWRAELWFGSSAVFVAARHLVNGGSVRAAPVSRVTYLHLAFDRHEAVFAEGLTCESLHLGPMSLAAMDGAQRAELMALFPELATGWPGETAHPCLRPWEVGPLVTGQLC